MKRTLKVIVVVSLMMLSSGMLLAQENPFVGTWKLNTGKTKFTGMPALKSETRTVAAQDSGIKVSFDGIGADGSKFSYSYTTNLDGRRRRSPERVSRQAQRCTPASASTRIPTQPHG